MAKMVAHGAYQPDFSGGIHKFKQARRPVVGFSVPLKGSQGGKGFKTALDFAGRNALIQPPFGRVANGHKLDETNLEGSLLSQPGKIENFIIIKAGYGNYVDFDGG